MKWRCSVDAVWCFAVSTVSWWWLDNDGSWIGSQQVQEPLHGCRALWRQPDQVDDGG